MWYNNFCIDENLTEKNKGDWDFKINVMNVTGFPELIEIIKGRSNQDIDSKVNLKEIVNFLQQQGVKHIVLFDLTCSPFVAVTEQTENLMDLDESSNDDNGEKTIENQRVIRNLRKNLLEKYSGKKVGGKKTKKKQKLTRKHKLTKKNKKTQKYKKHFRKHLCDLFKR